MIEEALLNGFLAQFDKLKDVVERSIERSMSEPPDPLFYENQNVFVKSYLVSACSMLEAFIQDLAIAYVNLVQQKINLANLPFNLVIWVAQHEKANMEFKQFFANKSKKDISDLISPNYWKTMQAFKRIGIDLSNSEALIYKDFISSIVEKRNNIVHHNDDALDLSFSDVIVAINNFKNYSTCLYMAVNSDPYLAH